MANNKIKHLDYIHNTINRMSSISFIIKGWTISIVSILFIFSDGKMNKKMIIVTVLAVIVFWYLNGFFLQQERKFRGLYNKIRLLSDEKIDFSMSTEEFNGGKYSIWCCVFGKTIWPLYLSITTMVLLIKQLA